MGESNIYFMTNVTEKEGVVNNSNQPSQTEKVSKLINDKVVSLREQMVRIEKEISSLLSIKFNDEFFEFKIGEVTFKYDEFFNEITFEEIQKWLKVKDYYLNQTEEEIESRLEDIKDDKWSDEYHDYYYNMVDESDIDPWEYIDKWDFISQYFDEDTFPDYKEDFVSQFSDYDLLRDEVEGQLQHM